MMSMRMAGAGVLAALAGGAGVAEGAHRFNGFPMFFDVSGIESRDGLGSSINEVRYMTIGPGNSIIGGRWDVALTAFSPSWRNEMAVRISDSSGGGGYFLRPGTDGSGFRIETSLDYYKLANYDLPNIMALGDGLIRLEFFETYDDFPSTADGVWNSGHLEFLTTIPAPNGAGLLGLAGVAAIGRRRRALEFGR